MVARACAAGVVVLASAVLSSAALASTLRCEKGIVTRGDTVYQVLTRCGDPQLKDSYTKSLRTTNHIGISVVKDVVVERWTYDRGRGKFVQILVFEGGRLTKFERGERR